MSGLELQVFIATTHAARNQLGERITSWLAAQRRIEVTDLRLLQSSNTTHHCLTVVVWYRRSS